LCTATWIHGADGGLEFFFNRDEARSRGPETPPAVHEAGSASEVVRYLAPGDSEGGGTWIAVSERGLCLGLLNAYGAGRGEEPESPTSRGLLIPDLIDAHSPREVAERLAGRDLFSFRPFVLLAVAPGPDRAEALVYRWDGLEGRR
jgi:hypothetical protein